jgi:hypothetical protein
MEKAIIVVVVVALRRCRRMLMRRCLIVRVVGLVGRKEGGSRDSVVIVVTAGWRRHCRLVRTMKTRNWGSRVIMRKGSTTDAVVVAVGPTGCLMMTATTMVVMERRRRTCHVKWVSVIVSKWRLSRGTSRSTLAVVIFAVMWLRSCPTQCSERVGGTKSV